MLVVKTPAEFFEDWLPGAFGELLTRAAASPGGGKPGLTPAFGVNLSLLVELGTSTWTLHLAEQRLRVQPGSSPHPTFAIRLNQFAFEQLVLPAVTREHGPQVLIHFARLDAETCRLASNIPGSLGLRARGDSAVAEVVFGPGSANLDHPSCNVSCLLSDLAQVQTGQQSPMDLFINGKLSLDGNLEVALALGGLLMG
jgi:hypothetical protein